MAQNDEHLFSMEEKQLANIIWEKKDLDDSTTFSQWIVDVFLCLL
jgi:hypothetical protein